MAEKAQIPGKYLKDDSDDFAAPLAALLTGVGLLGTENKNQKEGLNELQEGALGVSKWIGTAAGATGIAGLVTTIVGGFSSAQEPTRVAAIAGGSVVLAAGVIALGFVVRADVRARVGSTMAQYEARSQVSTAFLALAGVLLGPTPPATPATNGGSSAAALLSTLSALGRYLRVKAKNHPDELGVVGVRLVPGGELQIRLEDGDWVTSADVETFEGDLLENR